MYLHGHLLPNATFSAVAAFGCHDSWALLGPKWSDGVRADCLLQLLLKKLQLVYMDCVWHMGLKFTTFLCHGHTLNKEICINLRDVPLLLILRCLQLQGPGRTFLLRPQIMGDAQSQLGQGPETRRDVMGQWNKTKHVVTHLKIWFYIVSNSPEYWGWDAYWLEPKTQEMEDVWESLSGWQRLKEGKFRSFGFFLKV